MSEQNNSGENEVNNETSQSEEDTTSPISKSQTVQPKPKRLQAQRACSNCKRLHARCDNERPCKRCTQNGLASTCVDLPRKRRMSRTYTEDYSVWEARYGSRIMNMGGNVAPPPPAISTPSALPWGTSLSGLPSIPLTNKDSYKPPIVQPTSLVNGKSVLGNIPPLVDLSHNHNYEPNLMMTEIVNPEDHRSNLNVGYAQQHASIPLSDTNPRMTTSMFEKQDPLVETFLYHQMSELRESNPHMDRKFGLPDLDQDLRQQKFQWHSFLPQRDFAISVWKGTLTPGLNYLVECNERFIELVGYSMDELKNNFPCQRLFVSKAFCGQKDWPKRTQVATAYGFKEVYLTIYPLIGDLSANKYFIVNMLELPPLPRVDAINGSMNLTHPELPKEQTLKTSDILNGAFKPELLRQTQIPL